MTVPVESSTASSTPDTPTWDDIVGAAMWRAGTAGCGCPLYRHQDDHADDHLGGGAPATLHQPCRCTDGRHDAGLDPRLARHIAIPVPEGADTVTADRATLAGALRGIPADGALDQVEAERSAERAYAEAGIERIEQRLALAAELEATIARLAEGGFATGDLAARVARLRGERPTVATPSRETFTVPPAPGAVPPAATAPTAPPAVDLAEQELLRAAAAAAADPTDVYARNVVERADEQAQLTIDLGAYLAHIPDLEARGREISALMAMTLAERSEAVEAAKAGRLHRLGLRLADLVPSAKGSPRAWLRLREGAAGQWSIEELVPFSDEEMQRLLTPVRPAPSHLGMFYARGLHILAGSGGIGKTWIALAACAGAVPAVQIPGHTGPYAMYLDLDNNYELYARASELGVDVRVLQQRKLELMQVPDEARKRGCSNAAALRSVLDGLVEAPPRVVIVDSLTRIISDLGESSDDNDAATRILSSLFDELAAKTCVIVLDHTGHEHARPRGASAKRDAVRVVLTVAPADFDAERHPDAIAGGKLIAGKDRDGGIRAALADPADKDATPDLGLVIVNRNKETGRAKVDLISQRTIAEASARRESDEGQTFAVEARRVIRRLVDAAARNAVTAEQAKAAGTKPTPPLSARGIEDAAWDELKDNKVGGRKSDVRDVIRNMTGRDLVEYQANWGSTPGVRYRLAGGITDGRLDPVDLD